MRRSPRTIEELHTAILEQGYTLQKGRRHIIVRRPNGTALMPIPVTPSDHRSVRKSWAQFRKAAGRPPRG